MALLKRLLLGGSAGLAVVGATQAADLPVKAKAVEYVKICSLYGDGFFYIPGTDTCLKIGGWVRTDLYFNQNSSGNPPNTGVAGQNSRATTPDFTTRSRTVVSFDARSQTEYGTLRAYYRGGFDFTAGLSSQYGNGSYYYERAFIQLGGWTFGRTQSYFDIFADQWRFGHYEGAGSYTNTYGTNVAAYTAQFGNGITATLAIEEGNLRRNAVWDATSGVSVAGVFPTGNAYVIGSASIGPMGPATNGFVSCGVALVGNDNTNGNANTTAGLNAVGCGWGDYAAQQVPDIVGNLRVEQAWGTAQVSGALHQVRANYYGNNFVVADPTFTGVSPGDKWGGAVNAGVMLNLPWNAGDKLWVEATWALGAPSYMGFGRDTDNDDGYARFNGASLANGVALDAVFANNPIMPMSGIQLSTAWSVGAASEHYWTPALRTSLFGSYAFWTPGSTGNTLMCSSPLAPIRSVATNTGPTGAAVLAGCNFDFASWGVGSRTIWNPVKNLDIGLEVEYQQIDQKMDPNLIRWNFGGAGTRPSGLYIPANEGAWTGLMRIQRSFYP